MRILIFAHFIIYNNLRGPLPIIFPWKGIWKVKAHRHVSFFVWTAMWDKILTSDNLRDRGFDFVDKCIMCSCNGETVDHLVLHCGKAYQLWSLVFRSFGILWVLPKSVTNTLLVGGIGLKSIHLAFGIWFRCTLCGIFGGSEIGGRLRTWKAPTTSCLLLSVAPFLTGLGLGDSPLVIFSLCFLVLFCN